MMAVEFICDICRRHNKHTHHYAIIQLASPGTVAGFDVDTSFFEGSHPAYASVEACLIVKDVQEEYEVGSLTLRKNIL
jgi:allantoicase